MNRKLALWQHFPVEDQSAASLVSAACAYQEAYNFDLIKIMPAGSWLATFYGVTDAWENDNLGRRTITGRCIGHEDDWLNLPAINEEINLIDTYVDVAQQLKKAYISKPVYITTFCPVSQAIQMAGLEQFKAHAKRAPEKVTIGLEKIRDNTIAVIKRFAATGIAGNYFVTQAMQYGMFTPDEYEQWGKPYDAACLKVSLQVFTDTIFHIHGEQIFFSIDPDIKNARVHFEYNSANAIESKSLSNHYLLPGIPATVLGSITSTAEAYALIDKIEFDIGQKLSLVTAGCVLPLDFPMAQVHFWKNILSKINER